jgi:hypothetical protein
MKKLLIFLFIIFWFMILLSQQKYELPDLNKAENVAVDDTQMYVTENTSVFIYSLKDARLVRKIGSQGDGPGEFRVLPTLPLSVFPQGNSFVINSFGKVTVCRKNGDIVSEKRTKAGLGNFLFIPIGEKYVGRSIIAEGDVAFQTANLFDKDLNRGKELIRIPYTARGGKIQILNESLFFVVYENRILITGGIGFKIKILNEAGEPLQEFGRKYDRRKFTQDDEQSVRKFLQLSLKQQYEILKNAMAFPSHYPEIAFFFAKDDLIYIFTWKRKGNHNEVFIYDINGKFLKQTYFPVHYQDALRPFQADLLPGALSGCIAALSAGYS